MGQFEVKTYSGIWPNVVTTVDWDVKAESIPAKKPYFKDKLTEGGLISEEVEKFTGFLKDLEEFDTECKAYHEIKEKQEKVQESLFQLEKSGKEAPKNAEKQPSLPQRPRGSRRGSVQEEWLCVADGF